MLYPIPPKDEIWQDIERELLSCINDGCSANLDEIDCERLLLLMRNAGVAAVPPLKAV